MLVSVTVALIIELAIGIGRYWASALSTIGVFIELITDMS